MHTLVLLQCDGDPIVNNIKRHAKHVAERLELDSVMETSAKTGFQVETVFERAITLVRTSDCTSVCIL